MWKIIWERETNWKPASKIQMRDDKNMMRAYSSNRKVSHSLRGNPKMELMDQLTN